MPGPSHGISEVVSRKVTIANKLGLHARAAAKLVTLASKFAADIRVVREGREANAKSIMGVMTLAAGQGACIELRAEGEDEEEAVTELERLIRARFEEPE